jgi:hypothetical protein
MLKRARNVIGAAVITLGVAQPAWATVQIVQPGDDVAGQSQLYWAEAWWRWILSVPQPTNPPPYNPGNDPTGQFAGANNNGPVFFLGGFVSVVPPGGSGSGPTSASRTIDVPYGKPVFFPVINDSYVPINQNGTFNSAPCRSPLTLGCAINASFLTVNDMAVQIDGISLDNAQMEPFRQTSVSYFSVPLPADNVFGVPVAPYNNCVSDAGAPCSNLWTQDGFYITLDDLSVGTHVLHFEGEGSSLAGGSFGQDVTATLIVTIPEPATWAMMLVGFAGLGFAAYRGRRAQRRLLRD